MLDWSAKQHTCAGAETKRDDAPSGPFVGGSHIGEDVKGLTCNVC
jgi:hypothetical protein